MRGTPTQAELNAAIEAACSAFSISPLTVFDDGPMTLRARKLAAAALAADRRGRPSLIAEALQVAPKSLFPSQWERAGISERRIEIVVAKLPARAVEPEPAPIAAVANVVRVKPELPIAPKVVAPPAPAPVARTATPAPQRSGRHVRPAAVRYARWFMAARWSLETVAHLFDVDAQDLAIALRRGE